MPDNSPISSLDLASPAPRGVIKCPKCSTEARDADTFCTRCHTTLRFRCPSCAQEQRLGGACEKCGIDFIKYIDAVLVNKKVEADQFHDRVKRRSTLPKNILLLPFTLGVPLVRSLFVSRVPDK